MRWAIAAADHRSLRRAAEVLNVRESTLSRRMRELEYRLGVELFERTANGTRLTTAGDEFVAVAKHILAETDAAFARMKAWGAGESGDLVIGICTALSIRKLRTTLGLYGRQHQKVKIHSVDRSRARLFADLASGTVDVFLTAQERASWSGASLPLWNERVLVALPVDHGLCSNSLIRWPDLANARVLVNRPDLGPDFETMLRAQLGEQSDCTFIIHEVSLDRLQGFVGAGLGLTLVPESAAGGSDSGVAYRALYDGNSPVRMQFVAYWKESNRNPALRPFLDLLSEHYTDVTPSSSAD